MLPQLWEALEKRLDRELVDDAAASNSSSGGKSDEEDSGSEDEDGSNGDRGGDQAAPQQQQQPAAAFQLFGRELTRCLRMPRSLHWVQLDVRTSSAVAFPHLRTQYLLNMHGSLRFFGHQAAPLCRYPMQFDAAGAASEKHSPAQQRRSIQ